MAVVGIGVDAVDVDRLRRAIARTPALLDRVFTPAERDQCGDRGPARTVHRLAARFAAKEAVAKALGTGVVGFGFRDVEIVNDAAGAPSVVLGSPAAAVARGRGIVRVHISLTMTHGLAVASAVAES